MSDAGLDPTLSDQEVDDVATPGSGDVEAPRDTVEENGLGEDDDDDLFGDGGDDAEEPA